MEFTKGGDLIIGTNYFILRSDDWSLERIWGSPDFKPNVYSIEVVNEDFYYWACERDRFYRYRDGVTSLLDSTSYFCSDIIHKNNSTWLLSGDALYYFNDGIKDTVLTDETGTGWFRKLLKDREGNIWIGAWEGLIKIKPSHFSQYEHGVTSNLDQVYAFGEDKHDDLLFGGNHGALWRKKGDHITRAFIKNEGILPSAEIFAIHQYKDDLWLGTGYKGIVLYRNGELTRFTQKDGLADDSRYFFFTTSDGRLWTGGDGGLDEIIYGSNGDITFHSVKDSTGSPAYASLYNAIEGPDHTLWIGGTHGLMRLQNETLTRVALEDGVKSSMHITDVVKADHDEVWLSTLGEGILQCAFTDDHQLRIVQKYGRNEGLPTGAYLCLLADRQGNIWAGSYQGVCRFYVAETAGRPGRNKNARRAFRFYDVQDGFPDKSFSTMCLYQAKDQVIWGGTSAGVFSFRPDQLMINAHAPKALVTGIEFLSGDEAWEPETPLRDSLFGLPLGLSLPHDKNSVEIHFAASSLTKPSAIKFRYRLKGKDTEWTDARGLRSARYQALPAGKFHFSVQAANEDGVWSKTPATFSFEIKPQFWQTWWFRVIAMACLGLGLVFTIQYWRKRKREAEEAEKKERALLGVQKEIAELKLTALQAQMNPHFIFNSLNSINWYILKNKTAEASTYLTKFSKLVRRILDNSKNLTIPLDKELDALRLYLDLEAMRFETLFDYEIQTDDAIDLEEVMIPPLILQPFVENAIWHGLMPKGDKGNLLIQIYPEKMTASTQDHHQNGTPGACLKCIVQDDGIGRRASQKRKTDGRRKHESKGLKLTTDRIKLIHNNYLAENMIRVIDLVGANGEAAGTRVELILPYDD